MINHDEFEGPLHLIFSSGAGAWKTDVQLNNDGFFTGMYQDTNTGESGNGYSSTTYISKFNGQFTDIKKLDEKTYSMKLLEMNYTYEDGEEWIEGEDKYIATDAFGFEEGKDYKLYSPHKNMDDLDEELLSWGQGNEMSSDASNKLRHWVLHNEKIGYGFYSD